MTNECLSLIFFSKKKCFSDFHDEEKIHINNMFLKKLIDNYQFTMYVFDQHVLEGKIGGGPRNLSTAMTETLKRTKECLGTSVQ
jgi:hypothetical protein